MRRIHGFMGKLVLGLFLLLMIFIITPNQALAFELNVENSFSETLWFATVEYDDPNQAWQIHGWWSVSPHSTRTLQFPNSTSKRNVWIYGYTAKASFHGQGLPGSLNYTIVGEKFHYWAGSPCPPGSNRRTVTFSRLDINEGFAYWSPAGG